MKSDEKRFTDIESRMKRIEYIAWYVLAMITGQSWQGIREFVLVAFGLI